MDAPAKMHGVGASHAWYNPCLVQVGLLQRCVVLVQPTFHATHTWMPLQRCTALMQPLLGARGALAEEHSTIATHAWCNQILVPRQSCTALVQPRVAATHAWCNQLLVTVMPLQRCTALVQPMLGATHAWCTWCPCRGAWCWCNPLPAATNACCPWRPCTAARRRCNPRLVQATLGALAEAD